MEECAWCSRAKLFSRTHLKSCFAKGDPMSIRLRQSCCAHRIRMSSTVSWSASAMPKTNLVVDWCAMLFPSFHFRYVYECASVLEAAVEGEPLSQ